MQTVTSIDASNVAKIYKTIQPRLNEAYRAMGNPNGDVDRALQQTLDILLDTPVVKDPIALIEGDGAGWVYADDDLEELRRRRSSCCGWDRRTSTIAGVAARAAERAH